jgi:hypothetical protein
MKRDSFEVQSVRGTASYLFQKYSTGEITVSKTTDSGIHVVNFEPEAAERLKRFLIVIGVKE